MHSNNNFELYEQLEDLDGIPSIRNVPQKQTRKKAAIKKRSASNPVDEMFELAEKENELNFSYGASKHEQEWLIASLQDFYRQQWFDDILRLIKGGGKEASVYQCLGNQSTKTQYVAAKVYRPRKFRQLRNDSLYREGRIALDDEGHEIRDDRAMHAIQQRTAFGMRLLHTSWIEHEFQTMSMLHKAGAALPEPYVSGNNAILMAYIGWDDLPAPTLNTVNLTVREAKQVLDDVLHNVEIMLENKRVHGDLSAYNILYFEGEIFLIDFPQAIDPRVNRSAYAIFRRDITRLCEYFQVQGLHCKPQPLADSIWRNHGYDITPNIHPSLLEPEVIDD